MEKNEKMEFHLFHYLTHTVEWMILFGDTIDGGLRTTDGQGLAAWCTLHLTAEGAQESVMRAVKDHGFLYEHVEVVEYGPTQD